MATYLVSPDYDTYANSGISVVPRPIIVSPENYEGFTPPATVWNLIRLNEPDIYAVAL